MARANNKQLWACNPSVCAVTRPSAEEPAHLQPLEQPLHQALLRGLGAHLRPELRHVLHDRWGDTHKTAALPDLLLSPGRIDTAWPEGPRAALLFSNLHLPYKTTWVLSETLSSGVRYPLRFHIAPTVHPLCNASCWKKPETPSLYCSSNSHCTKLN